MRDFGQKSIRVFLFVQVLLEDPGMLGKPQRLRSCFGGNWETKKKRPDRD
jgi:hypothetical protein